MTNRTTNTSSKRVYNVSKNGTYKRDHKTKRIRMRIMRGDTRHGGTSEVVLWSDNEKNKFALTLSEARSLRAFLDRELEVLAR